MAYQIDRSKCLCCHNCALECPVQAIHYVGTGYSVDAARCIDCGHCAAVCNVDAAGSLKPESAPQQHDTIRLTADIVVLGAGAAGIVAAVRAAEQSKGRIIVLEKAKKFGGSGWFAGFMVSAPGSKAALPPMIQAAQKTLLEGGIDPEILSLGQEGINRFFQWFRQLDERVDQLWKPCPEPGGTTTLDLTERVFFNRKCRDKAIGPGRSTSVMEEILVEHFAEHDITLLTQHQAVQLRRDQTGAVCGVLAKDPGGMTEIACKAVICCTGGFANNENMMRTYAPQYYGAPGDEPTHRFAAPTNTGDVVKLAESVGACLDTKHFFANVFGPVHHPFSFCLFSFALQPEMLNVNLEGKRFMDESTFGAGAAKIIHQPGRVAWSILDHPTRQLLGARLSRGPDGEVLADFAAEFAEEAELDTPLKQADTLEELADLCGIQRDTFLKTVSRYNEYCKQGKDPEFGKRTETMRPVEHGPFYAIYGKVACDGAFGGMLVNSRMEVFTEDRSEVIPGLFAAGDNSSGWALRSEEEGDHRLMVCNECNWAITSGFAAGESAADYLREKA